MKKILIILGLSNLLLMGGTSDDTFQWVREEVTELTTDILVEKDSSFNKKVALNLKKEIVQANMKEEDNSSFMIDELSKEDKLRIGIISNEALLYHKNTHQKDLNQKIKMLMPLYGKPIYIFVDKSSTINSLADLNHKKVSIGAKNSNSWFVAQILKKEHNLEWNEELNPLKNKEDLRQISFKLLTNKLDTFVYVGDKDKNLIEEYFLANTGEKLKLLEISSKYFKTKELNQKEHKWLDEPSKKVLYTKELLVAHNFYFIKGKSPNSYQNYEKTLKTIKHNCGRQIKEKFKIDTRDFHGATWDKWLDGNQISYRNMVN